MSEKNKKRLAYVIAIILLLLIGFFVGRSTVKTNVITKTKFVKGETIEVEVDKPVPVYVCAPIDTTNIILAAIKSGDFNDLFPEKIKDSLIYVTKDDTSAVITDWATERHYKEKLFDIDTVGVAFFEAKVQFNRLFNVKGEFTPIVKETTTKEFVVKRFSPFVGVGVTVMPGTFGGNRTLLTDQEGMGVTYEYQQALVKNAIGGIVQAGMFFEDKYGVSLLYEYGFTLNTHTLGGSILYKF